MPYWTDEIGRRNWAPDTPATPSGGNFEDASWNPSIYDAPTMSYDTGTYTDDPRATDPFREITGYQPWTPETGGYKSGGLPTGTGTPDNRDLWEKERDKMGQGDSSITGRPSSNNPSGGGYRAGSSGGLTLGQTMALANKKSTTRMIGPEGPMPEAPTLDQFVAPTRDEERIKALTQQKSAAGLRAMRAQIQKAMGQGYRNENVKRMTLRDALSGYGQGIESVMTGAQTGAEKEYQSEYATAYDTAGKNYQSAITAKMQDWQNKINNYFKNYSTETVTTNV
jgi:hypothetical protein